MVQWVAFRVDSSFEIGTGHWVRCSNLAREIASRGFKIVFVGTGLKVEDNGWIYHSLERNVRCSNSRDWLGCNWDDDLCEFTNLVESLHPFLVVVDHYGIDHRWEKECKGRLGAKILVIDDLADRQHACDFIVDQTCIISGENRYEHLIPDGCVTLFGSDYCILNPVFKMVRETVCTTIAPEIMTVRTLFICFGGSDPLEATYSTLKALMEIQQRLADLKRVIVVLGSATSHSMREKIARDIQLNADLAVFTGVVQWDMAKFLAQSDAAIGAAGVSIYERCCVGVPSAVVTVAENQIPNATRVQEQGAVHVFGSHHVLSNISQLGERIYNFCSDTKTLLEIKKKGLKLVHGDGLRKIIQRIL